MKLNRIAAVFVLTVLSVSISAVAQQAGTGQTGNGQDTTNGGTNRGRGNFQQFRQRMEDRLKTALGATDDEWTVLEPKIQKVQEAQRAMYVGRGGMTGRRRRGGNENDTQSQDRPQPSAVQQKAQDLQEALNNKDTSPADIKAKLAALRDARTQAQAALTAAQGELRDVLTPRQEAVLVMYGILN